MKSKALSKDRFIINQSSLTQIPYGKYSSAVNGCGWIAVYNYLRLLHSPLPAKVIIRQMEHGLLFRGKIGTNLFFLYGYLWYLGHPSLLFPHFTFTIRRTHAKKGILMYYTGSGIHFAAFRRISKTHFCFYNAVNGKEKHHQTMSEFINTYNHFPLLFLITPLSCKSLGRQ